MAVVESTGPIRGHKTHCLSESPCPLTGRLPTNPSIWLFASQQGNTAASLNNAHPSITGA